MKSIGHRNPQQHPLGHTFEDSEITVFFGNRNSRTEELKSYFPDIELKLLKQTHSNHVQLYEQSTLHQEAQGDAHITGIKQVALGIKTADCIPVMIFDPDLRMIAAIHAGWRGVENEIIIKTGQHLKALGSTLRRAQAWVGPHIGFESFEIGLDVASQLLKAFEAVRGYSSPSDIAKAHEDKNKIYLNLTLIASAQIRSLGIDDDRMNVMQINTVASPEHHSFRRDGKLAGRQISFIALK